MDMIRLAGTGGLNLGIYFVPLRCCVNPVSVVG